MRNNYAGHLTLIGLFPTRFEAGRTGFYLDGRTPGTELEAEGLRHFEDRRELDIPITRQCPVQGVNSDTSVPRQLIHSFRTNNSAKSLCDLRRIVPRVINATIEVNHQILISREQLRRVQLFRFDVTHNDLPKPSQNVEGKPSRSSRLIPTVAKYPRRQYGTPVVANSATRVWSLDNAKGAQAPHKNAGAFFVPVVSIYGGCVWEAFAPAGFLLPRLTNPHTVRLHSFGHEGGGSPAKGAVPMQHILGLNPSKVRALAHRRMALNALRADSSLSVRLKRYNDHMTIVRALEMQGGTE